MADITIHMKFFGVLRKFGEGLDFSMPAGSKVSAVREVLQNKLGEALVSDCAFADENSILRDSDILKADAKLSILPPVCGG